MEEANPEEIEVPEPDTSLSIQEPEQELLPEDPVQSKSDLQDEETGKKEKKRKILPLILGLGLGGLLLFFILIFFRRRRREE